MKTYRPFLNVAKRKIMMRQIKDMIKESHQLSKDAIKTAENYLATFDKDAHDVIGDSTSKAYREKRKQLQKNIYDSYDMERTYYIVYSDGASFKFTDLDLVRGMKVPTLSGVSYMRVERRDQIYADTFSGWMSKQTIGGKIWVQIPDTNFMKPIREYEDYIDEVYGVEGVS